MFRTSSPTYLDRSGGIHPPRPAQRSPCCGHPYPSTLNATHGTGFTPHHDHHQLTLLRSSPTLPAPLPLHMQRNLAITGRYDLGGVVSVFSAGRRWWCSLRLGCHFQPSAAAGRAFLRWRGHRLGFRHLYATGRPSWRLTFGGSGKWSVSSALSRPAQWRLTTWRPGRRGVPHGGGDC